MIEKERKRERVRERHTKKQRNRERERWKLDKNSVRRDPLNEISLAVCSSHKLDNPRNCEAGKSVNI